MAMIIQSRSICQAITRLRSGVFACCWIVGIALACQVFIWSLATYTELRYDIVEEKVETAPLIVNGQTRSERRMRAPQAGARQNEKQHTKVVLNSNNQYFASLVDFSGGVGRLAMVVLVVAMGLGVVLSAGSAIAGAERTILAFLWTVVLALLVLPVGKVMDLPWEDGALTSYEYMGAWVDRVDARRAESLAGPRPAVLALTQAAQEEPKAPSMVSFHAKFLLLPLACLVGLVMVALRFNAAVEAAIMQRESGKLDPALEREASNISPSSLHRGRSASILTRAIGHSSDAAPRPGEKVVEDEPHVDSPKRLI